eukprot:2566138-Pyramimonas_sp.AAC.1
MCCAAARLDPQVGACQARVALQPLVHGRAWSDPGPQSCLQSAPARAELRLDDAIGILGWVRLGAERRYRSHDHTVGQLRLDLVGRVHHGVLVAWPS